MSAFKSAQPRWRVFSMRSGQFNPYLKLRMPLKQRAFGCGSYRPCRVRRAFSPELRGRVHKGAKCEEDSLDCGHCAWPLRRPRRRRLSTAWERAFRTAFTAISRTWPMVQRAVPRIKPRAPRRITCSPSQSPGPWVNNPTDPDNPTRGRSVGGFHQDGIDVPEICRAISG